MDEFHINFNILEKYGDFESWKKAELSPRSSKDKERKAVTMEKQNGIS